jgi:S-adenosylmethionine:tRNA ribosyltransferase-isomerase
VLTAEFDYDLPPQTIAQRPVEPRHSARLLDTRDMSDHLFLDLPQLLEPGDLLVVNHTRVRAARLRGHKVGSGGAVEVVLLRRLDGHWEALVRPARRLRPGTEVSFGRISARILQGPERGIVVMELSAEGDLEEAISAVGEIPLPPYIAEGLSDPERYQTIFSRNPGSAAAPTAGLHFTEEVVKRLHQRRIEIASVDLEVGLDTFRPIVSKQIESHHIHTERYQVDGHCASAIRSARDRDGKVVAVGTTSVRALESRASGEGLVEPGEGSTDLFVRPGYRFNVVDAVITNFHLPRTTLIVLIAAVMGDAWRKAYSTAIDRGYRFLSFGDAMYAETSR